MIDSKSFSLDASYNERVVRHLQGEVIPAEFDNTKSPVEDLVRANSTLAKLLYGDEVGRLIGTEGSTELADLYNDAAKEVMAPEEVLEGIDLENSGLVLVRQEALHFLKDCVELIKIEGVEVVDIRPRVLDFRRYWMLYPHGVSEPAAAEHFPTRTLNFINKLSVAILLRSNQTFQENHSTPLSNYLANVLKGSRGNQAEGTFRGDVAFRNLAELTVHDKDGWSFKPEVQMALDPLGIYANIANGKIPTRDKFYESYNPLLYYAGQLVHIPNREEIPRDLRAIYSATELERIFKK